MSDYVTTQGITLLENDPWGLLLLYGNEAAAADSRIQTASRGRATGSKWQSKHVCVPGDVTGWFNALKTPFTIRQYTVSIDSPSGPRTVQVNARWAVYQTDKCGRHECSVHEDKQTRKRPVADGINASKVVIRTETGPHACLILDAKSSKAAEENSLYGIRDNEGGFWDYLSGRKRTSPTRRITRRLNPLEAVDDLMESLSALTDADGYRRELAGQSQDPTVGEDDDSGTFATDRDDVDSKYQAVREAQLKQMVGYETACSLPTEIVPMTRYLIIVERDFMVEYFRSILTVNGIVVRSAHRNGESWAP